MIIQKTQKAFSMIEILVWIFIFSMWIISVYSLIISTLKLTDYNKNYIIASNLAKEQIELVRYIRDSNYNEIYWYNHIPWTENSIIEPSNYYKIENDYSDTTSSPVKLEEITDFWEWKDELSSKMQNYRLCLDDKNRYTYDCWTWNTQTAFYKYIKVDDVVYEDWGEKTIENSLKITSKVIWYKKWYHEFEMKSIITDYKKF